MAILLAIDAGTRKTGWAVFSREASSNTDDSDTAGSDHSEPPPSPYPHWDLVETGVIIAHPRLRETELSERVRGILDALDNIVDRWDPQQVACGKPSPMQLVRQQEGMEKLGVALERWAREHKLRMCCYPHRDIRSALSGRPNAAKEELAYAVMTRWGLLGTGKNTYEWNAIAVGDYHLSSSQHAVANFG